MRIGNNNYHIRLGEDIYIGCTVLNNTVVKAWAADLRTKPLKKLPGFFQTPSTLQVIRDLYFDTTRHEASRKKAISTLFESYAPPSGLASLPPIEDVKDIQPLKDYLAEKTNEQLYSIGIELELDTVPNIEWHKRLKKTEYIESIAAYITPDNLLDR